MTGKDYIELLKMKNFIQSSICFDYFHEGYSNSNRLEELNVYKNFTSFNNPDVNVEIALCCIDINAINEEITIDDEKIEEDEYEQKIDEQINYELFECISINVYGEFSFFDSLDDGNCWLNSDSMRGIGLKNKKYFASVNPFYELTSENLEQVLYIQNSIDKTEHINFLLQNYLYYFDKVINPIINPFMRRRDGCVCKSDINLVVADKDCRYSEDTKIKLIYCIKDAIIFEIYIDILYGNLYGTVYNGDEDKSHKYINLDNITTEELLHYFKNDYCK
jgi:hypothetical protein